MTTDKELPAPDRLSIFAVFLSVAIVYCFTFSHVPTSDGVAWASFIDQRDWEKIFWPYHLLPEFLILLAKEGLRILSVEIDTVKLIQIVNVLLSGVSSVIFYKILQDHLRFETLISLLGTLIFAFSFSLWYFANGELHHFGLVFLLLIFSSLLRYAKDPSSSGAFGIGFLHAMANVMHQEHCLMFIPIAWILIRNSRRHDRIKNFLIYLATSVGISLALFGAVSVIVHKVSSIPQFFDFFFMMLTDKGSPQTYFSYVAGGDHSFFRMLKGSFLSLHYGSQIVVDYLRSEEIRAIPSILLLFAATMIGAAVIIFLSIQLLMHISKLKNQEKTILIGALVWLLTYKGLLNIWHWPGAAEYHLVTIPPFLILLFLGLRRLKKRVTALAILGALFLSMFSVNLIAGILPWKAHGKTVSDFKLFSETYFRPDDLFLSCESSLDPTVSKKWELFSTKGLFKQADKQEGFTLIKTMIESAHRQKRRVFIYNFIPAKFALDSINFYNQNDRFSEQDFENMFSELQGQFQVRAFYEYREGAYSQPYIPRSSNDYIWLVEKR